MKIDLVHKGSVVQTVVDSWYLSPGYTIGGTISSSNLGGYPSTDDFYFRFNSEPGGHYYNFNGEFGPYVVY